MSGLSKNWNRYALIIELARRIGDKNRFGKKALQKLVYLLQEREGIPMGYRFRFYTYGPYSDDLSFDLDVVNGMKGVGVNYDPSERSYQISPGEKAAAVSEQGMGFVQTHSGSIDRLLHQFGGRTAKDLELTATIVYLLNNNIAKAENEIVTAVRELKPKYDDVQILRAFREL